MYRRPSYSKPIREVGPRKYKTRKPKRSSELLEVATPDPVCVSKTTPILNAVKLMSEKNFRRLPVVDAGSKKLIGMLTSTDIVNYFGGGDKYQLVEKRYYGNLYRALNAPVEMIMHSPPISVYEDSSIDDVIEIMLKKNIGGIPIVDENEVLKAIITERDILRILSGTRIGSPISEIMSKDVISISENAPLMKACRTMIEFGFRRLPALNEKFQLTGILTSMDVVKFFASEMIFKMAKLPQLLELLQTPVNRIMTPFVITAGETMTISEALELMTKHNIGALPIISEKRTIVGIVTERDVMVKLIELS